LVEFAFDLVRSPLLNASATMSSSGAASALRSVGSVLLPGQIQNRAEG